MLIIFCLLRKDTKYTLTLLIPFVGYIQMNIKQYFKCFQTFFKNTIQRETISWRGNIPWHIEEVVSSLTYRELMRLKSSICYWYFVYLVTNINDPFLLDTFKCKKQISNLSSKKKKQTKKLKRNWETGGVLV